MNLEQAKQRFSQMTNKELIEAGKGTYSSLMKMGEGILKDTTKKFLKLIEDEQDARGIY